MRLKYFSAPSMAEIMSKVRDELGQDAIIISTEEEGGQVRVAAALEEVPAANADGAAPRDATETGAAALRRALDYHGAPLNLAVRLIDTVRLLQIEDPEMGLAAALDDQFRFAPLPVRGTGRPVMLLGPPGAGKTVTAAKLAARGALRGDIVRVISTDTVKAGGVAQLKAFTDILGVELVSAPTPERMIIGLSAGDAIDEDTTLTVIDTPGANPFDKADMAGLKDFIAAADPIAVLTLPAGLDSRETAEIGGAFAEIGVTHLLVTRLDLSRRMGGAMAAADAAHLSFCDVGISAQIAHGLRALNPVALARLLMRDPASTDWINDGTEPKS